MLEFIFKNEQRANTFSPMNPKDPGLISLFGGGHSTAAGVRVTADTATRINAVYACIGILAESMAALPLDVFERLDGGGKRKSINHPLHNKLHNQPNRWQTSFEWREMMIGHLMLRGNAYSEIISTGNNPVAELIPLHPDRVTPFWAPNGNIAYQYRPESGESRVILQEEMHHLKLRSNDGLTGISPIDECRESLGLASAAEEFGSRFFSNGSTLTGVLEHPGKLSDKGVERLRKDWEERHQGAPNSNRVAIFEDGMQWKQIGIVPEQAQFLETRKFQIAEIARIFRIPPHMLADLERATFNNIEELGISFVKYTLNHLIVRWEQVMFRDLIAPSSRRKYVIAFNVEGLLRGDTKSRAEFYKTMQNLGNMSINEVREKENLNPIPGGDVHMVPLNMTTLDKLGAEDDDDGTPNVQP